MGPTSMKLQEFSELTNAYYIVWNEINLWRSMFHDDMDDVGLYFIDSLSGHMLQLHQS